MKFSDFLIAALVSAFFALFGGLIGVMINPTGEYYMIGFFIAFVPLLILFTYSAYSTNQDEKKASKANIEELYEKCDGDLQKAIEEMAKITGLTESNCRNRITNKFITPTIISKYLSENNYELEASVKAIYDETNYDLNEINKKVSDAVKVHEKEVEKRIKKEQAEAYIQRLKEQEAAKPLPPKKQYKDNKKAGIVSCPKCGSTSITTTNKKISVGKGVAGAAVGALVNPVGTVVGAAVGATHSKKIYNVCMNCGHKWKP